MHSTERPKLPPSTSWGATVAMPRLRSSSSLAYDRKPATGQGQCLGDELPELAVPHYQYPVIFSDPDLLLNLQGSCEGLGEHRLGGVEAFRDDVQVSRGKNEVFGEGAVAPGDSENGAIAAVGGHSRPAAAAGAACGVYLPDHLLAGERARLDDADELVARYTAERVVAPGQLDVGVADAGDEDPDLALVRGGLRSRQVAAQGELSLLEPQPFHGSFSLCESARCEGQ